MCACTAVQAQRQASPDAQILQRAAVVAQGARISLLADQVTVDAALLPLLEKALDQMEVLTGRTLDIATMGPRVQVVVSAQTRVSHVWRGYEHPLDPRALVFLAPRVAHDAMRGLNATYVHELAHVLTWRYHSHTLREGLADYLALQVVPGAGVGPNRAGVPPPGRVTPQISALLGSSTPSPAWLTTDAELRREYYWASRRFVQHLIELKGLETFMRLYESPQPEQLLPEFYGTDQATLVQQAGL
ncbi:hypothetical protein PGB34_13320 [Xenophilus arseniciresistens]|uniref:Uncharacterized protein n=1 Tax=Xenophilus arseniciresistens TaxID=1283306 RepID=A0AAE3ND00_9BURK|nr:hypothetical protein [Xenophilus arseniciresistens]MDA7417344.1 hypothetical protein [Xenophilus arseniciresistens]